MQQDDIPQPAAVASASSGPTTILVVVLLAIAALLYFTRLGATPLRVNAEIRAYEITRNMVQTGDYLVPVFRGDTRVNKPPLYYWSAIAVSRLCGGFDLFTHRVPAATCALGVLLLCLAWGRILGAPREVFGGLLILAVTYLFVVHARRGSFEMMLTFFCNAAVLSFYLSATKRSFGLAMLGSVLFGLAFLTKATPALLYVPAVLAVWLWGQGKLRQLLRREMIPVVLVGGAISVAWYIYILLFRPDTRTLLLVETLLPFGIKASEHVTALHREPFYFYAVDIWRAAYPLCLFIPLLIWYAIRRRGFPAASPERLLLIMIVLPFVVFTLMPMKQDHYLLPSVPALAMLTGLAIAEAAKAASGWARYLLTVPVVIICVVGLAGSLIVGVGTRLVCDAPIVAAVVWGAAVAAASVAGLWFLSRRRIMSSVAALSVVMGLAFGWYFVLIRPIEDGFGSGELFNSPTYNAAHWEEKFTRYPLLRRLLDYDRGLKAKKKRTRAAGIPINSVAGEE